MAKRNCLPTADEGDCAARAFYRAIDRTAYPAASDPLQHPFFPVLRAFIDRRGLANKKVLEVGSGLGVFQDLVDDYVGVDVAASLAPRYHKEYHVVQDAVLPFEDARFDAVFSYATHEHITKVETAFAEIIRVLRVGGVCLLAPAWHTRSWFAKGILVRPYRDLPLLEKAEKLLLPLRNAPLYRWPKVFARRIAHLALHLAGGMKPGRLRYGKLAANYETFWHSDSDACNSLDPFDVLVWYRSRGMRCVSHPSLFTAVLLRTVALELQKSSDAVERCSGKRGGA